ncbi:hypothetical protein [Sporosarcina sp. BP05]|uniref:hypothetical protein n=1 Tax=Sporosarcina sp. BP05 TaxID=2758726 RepID=UPI0016470C19|nr:hypothetical protein [Sporosarcina sp. BP05]
MLVKVYIKKYMFHLPMKDSELHNQVQEKLKKEVDKSSIYKLYPLTKIEDDNGNILIEKQHTNIFLLNFLLLVLNHNEKEIEKQEHYSNNVIIGKLEKEIKSDLKALTFEAIEKEVSNYLNPTLDKPQIEAVEPEKETEVEKVKEESSHLENVRFSVGWLRGAQKEIDGRE